MIVFRAKKIVGFFFYRSGKIRGCDLAKACSIQSIFWKEGTSLIFHENGKIETAILEFDEQAIVNGTNYKSVRLYFDREGNLISVVKMKGSS